MKGDVVETMPAVCPRCLRPWTQPKSLDGMISHHLLLLGLDGIWKRLSWNRVRVIFAKKGSHSYWSVHAWVIQKRDRYSSGEELDRKLGAAAVRALDRFQASSKNA